jgi:hypothetical protein
MTAGFAPDDRRRRSPLAARRPTTDDRRPTTDDCRRPTDDRRPTTITDIRLVRAMR